MTPASAPADRCSRTTEGSRVTHLLSTWSGGKPVFQTISEKGKAMEQTPPASSEHPFIESDRVEGTAVYDAKGDHIGTIDRLMIEKVSGQVAYVVMSFGGLFGSDKGSHTLPWGKLKYDPQLRGYRTDISESELREAPNFAQPNTFDWSNRDQEQELHDYYRIPPYWRAM